MTPFIDPRDGDFESDAASTKNRSILSLAGSLISEISLPKLIVAWFTLIGFPALMLGAMPILASIWFNVVVAKFSSALYGLVPALVVIAFLVAGLVGWRRLLGLTERSFWSLNSLAVQPVYAICRELLNQLGDRFLPDTAAEMRRARWRSVTAVVSGIVICLVSIGIFFLAFPHTRLAVEFWALSTPLVLVKSALANSIAIVSAYVAAAVLVWSIADATMPPTRHFDRFGVPSDGDRTWRIAHLSDTHVVGEEYGFRIESGRSGPRGNGQLLRIFEKLDEIHAISPLDAVLVTGDITDAGLSTEWAEFLDTLASFPQLAKLMLIIPGNHDINVVSRANPAQFDLPMSPFKTLRKLRALSAINAVQGARVHVVDRQKRRIGDTLEHALTPCIAGATKFADTRRPRLHLELDDLWSRVFPMVLPPDQNGGLGIVLLDSNADTHFSFTNALGMVSADQFTAMSTAIAQYPDAGWIVCIHHHVVEYPRAAVALSERIGTALINGQWFVRRLQRFADRIVVMHGHRHVDWFGACGAFPILSAPSTVMGHAPSSPTYFYIHTIAIGTDGRLKLLDPQQIVVSPQPGARSRPAV